MCFPGFASGLCSSSSSLLTPYRIILFLVPVPYSLVLLQPTMVPAFLPYIFLVLSQCKNYQLQSPRKPQLGFTSYLPWWVPRLWDDLQAAKWSPATWLYGPARGRDLPQQDNELITRTSIRQGGDWWVISASVQSWRSFMWPASRKQCQTPARGNKQPGEPSAAVCYGVWVRIIE